MLEAWPLIAICSAFLVALCLSVYGGIKVFLRVKHSIAESKRLWGPAQRTVEHDVLGKIETRGHGLWEAQVPTRVGDVLVVICGTESAPRDAAVAQAVRLLPNVERLRTLASRVVREAEQSLRASQFELYGLDFTSGDVESCIVEINTDDDLDGIWRVEIRGEKAMLLGRDD